MWSNEMHSRYFWLFYLLLCPLIGCASINDSSVQPNPIAPASLLEQNIVETRGSGLQDPGRIESCPDPTRVITLRDALSLALLNNPELMGASWEIRALEARALQARALPNPELGVVVEEFGGNEVRKSFNTAQTTLQLSQLIELGSKRAKRVRLAQLDKSLAAWDYEIKRLDVLTGVSKSFVEVLAAQEQEALTLELLRLAEQVFNSVSERVKAGKISPLEETKSGVVLSNAKIEYEKARNNLQASRYRLAAIWGRQYPEFEKAAGILDDIKPIPSIDDLRNLISRNPDVARYVHELEQRAAALEVQKARRIPDLTISGGVQHFSENDEDALVVGATIPIPLFDQNRGGILEARHKLSKAREEYRFAQVKAGSGLSDAYHSLSSAYSEVLSLKKDVLPGAEQSFRASQEGFREGKFDFLELLDAQRTLFSARIRYIEFLANYHKAAAEVERLTGDGFDAALTKANGTENRASGASQRNEIE